MTRLIDADKLYPDCMTKEGTLAISQSQIANAETFPNRYDEGYAHGYVDGSTGADWKEKQMENRFVIIHCPYTGRYYIYTKTIVNGEICVDIVRIDQEVKKNDK